MCRDTSGTAHMRRNQGWWEVVVLAELRPALAQRKLGDLGPYMQAFCSLSETGTGGTRYHKKVPKGDPP